MDMSRHSFDPEIATLVGVNAAVIYQNIVWWTQKNAANKKSIRDGYVWTYNSRTAFGQLFPYLTQSQIKTAISKLVDSGLIIKGEYNAASYDRTNWYSPAISAKWIDDPIGQKSPMNQPEIANGLVKNRQPIPDGKPDIEKRDTNVSPKKGTRLPPDWVLCREWGEWAIAEGFGATEIRREAETFRDYWISVPGQKGVKLDWQATWRNWMRRNAKKGNYINGKATRSQQRMDAFIAGARGSN